MARIGRPPEPVPENIAAAVCAWLSEGKTLQEFCRQPGMPSRPTIDRWRQHDPAFASEVARARDIGYDVIAEDALRIADTTEAGETVTEDGKRRETRREDMLGHRKLRIETRLKLLACWDPRRYGPKALAVPLESAQEHAARVRQFLAEANGLDAAEGEVAT